MAELPPDDDEAPDDAESQFLIALWGHLDQAQDLSTRVDAMDHLEAVLSHCEQAVDVVRTWLAKKREN